MATKAVALVMFFFTTAEIMAATDVDQSCMAPLGMEDGRILNSQVSAYSSYTDNNNPATGAGRLNNGWAWRPSGTGTANWLQVSLYNTTLLTGLLTQGGNRASAKEFRVQYREEPVGNWMTYKNATTGENVVFSRPSEHSATVLHNFEPAVFLRYFRLRPVSYYGDSFRIRIELLGCESPTGTCDGPLGMEDGRITNTQLTASSVYNTDDNRFNPGNGAGRLYGRYPWRPSRNNVNQWLQIDLLERTTITNLISQGANSNVFVRTFVVTYRDDTTTAWQTYSSSDGDSTISRPESTTNTPVDHSFDPPIVARYFRINPKTWKGSIRMKVELLGCAGLPETTTAATTEMSTTTLLPTTSLPDTTILPTTILDTTTTIYNQHIDNHYPRYNHHIANHYPRYNHDIANHYPGYIHDIDNNYSRYKYNHHIADNYSRYNHHVVSNDPRYNHYIANHRPGHNYHVANIYSRYNDHIANNYSTYNHHIANNYSRYNHHFAKHCPGYNHGIAYNLPRHLHDIRRYIHDIANNYPRHSHDISNICFRYNHDIANDVTSRNNFQVTNHVTFRYNHYASNGVTSGYNQYPRYIHPITHHVTSGYNRYAAHNLHPGYNHQIADHDNLVYNHQPDEHVTSGCNNGIACRHNPGHNHHNPQRASLYFNYRTKP
ncbi:F5 [Branchiostoma lanceolatum]|uniref:F5 protein n=1 Tax=Branchiostoma lanceolatum TaxID=7740 RepID=A0A8J9YWE6_BRALA|nr:F5 [Branchiostoma lanceolatum]